jgi:integrase
MQEEATMSTNISISLDTRRPKEDGSYPIILRISHKRSNTSIPLGYYVSQDDWDEKKRQIRKKCNTVESVTRVNNHLEKKKAVALDVVTRLEDEGKLKSMKPAEIKIEILTREDPEIKVKKKSTFFMFTQELVEQMKLSGSYGNARIYGYVADAVRTFYDNDGLHFEQIDYRFLKRFETDYLSRGNGKNGLSHYMRTIRAIYNKAIKAGLVDRALYPFADYKIESERTRKRAIDRDDLRRIVELKLEEDHPCFYARNYFLASYEMYGMSFVDMAFLRMENLVGGRIRYQRKKTKKHYDIAITKHLAALLAFYTDGKEADDFVFPIIKRSELAKQYWDVEWARKRYNTALKELAALCGIQAKLTSYVSRHSFATQAMLSDVPINAISEMLGHSSLSTTQIYLKSLPSSILDDYHSRMSLED